MSVWLLFALVVLFAAAAVCWWGSGIIFHPPKMTKLAVFPEQFGLRYEKAFIKTEDGLTLRGWFIQSPDGPDEERTLLMCHGWGDNKGDLLEFTHYLNAEGFNLLYFDFRSHGESEGDVTTIGYYEIRDFDAAVEWLRENKPRCLRKLGVFGLSMGAAVSAMAVPSHPEVKAVVLESPFTEYRRVIRQWAWVNLRVPYFPLVMVTLWLLKRRAGEPKLDTACPINFVGRIAPRPLLVIGAEADDLMLEADVRRLFQAAGEPKQLWIVPEAVHAKCYRAAGVEYETRISSFFKRHLGSPVPA